MAAAPIKTVAPISVQTMSSMTTSAAAAPATKTMSVLTPAPAAAKPASAAVPYSAPVGVKTAAVDYLPKPVPTFTLDTKPASAAVPYSAPTGVKTAPPPVAPAPIFDTFIAPFAPPSEAPVPIQARAASFTNVAKVREAAVASAPQGYLVANSDTVVPVRTRPDPEVFVPVQTTAKTPTMSKARPALWKDMGLPAPGEPGARSGRQTNWKEAVPQAAKDADTARRHRRRHRDHFQPPVQTTTVIQVPTYQQPVYQPIFLPDSGGGGGGGGRRVEEEDETPAVPMPTDSDFKKPFPWLLVLVGGYIGYEVFLKKKR